MNFNKAQFLTSYGRMDQMPASTAVEIAFAGRSNVGKSSLINKLLNRKSLARVSSMPGKTVTINFFDVDGAHFVDLPGYGYAKVAKSEKQRWSKLMEGYFNADRNLGLVISLIDMRHPPTQLDVDINADRNLGLVISLIDMRHPPTQLDVDMVNYLIDREFPFIVVLTKSDKLTKRQQEERLKAFETEIPCGDQITMIPVSSEKGDGIPELQAVIQEVCEGDEE